MRFDPGETRMIDLGIHGVQVPLHSHLVFIWEDDKELADAVGFLLTGLRAGDHCVLLGSSAARNAVKAILAQHGFDLRALDVEGKLVTLPDERTADSRLRAITSAWQHALARKDALIRFMGFVSWKREDWSDDYELLTFESRLTAEAEKFPCVVVCMHDVRSTAGLLLRHGALETHPHVAWGPVVKENPFYLPASEFQQVAPAASAQISKFRELEDAVREAELRYRQLLESVDAIVWRGDPKTFRFTFVSKQAEKILGFPAEQWTTEADFWAGHIHLGDRDWAVNFSRKATEERRDHEFEYRMIAADGRIVWLRDSIHVISEGDHARELVGVMVDVSAEKQIEAELRASEQRFRGAFAHAATGLAISDLEGRLLEVNEAYCNITGYTAEELYATDFYAITHPADVAENRRLAARLVAGETQSVIMQKRYVRKDGSIAWVLNSVSVVRDDQRRPVSLISLSEDITQHKQTEQERSTLQEQLAQSQKLESIGRLAGGVAHDFNNLLTVILGHTALLTEQMLPDDPTLSSIGEIEAAAKRAESLTTQLLAFSRRQVLRPRVFDLNDAVVDTERMLRRVIPENIKLQTVLAGRLEHVRADVGQVHQVIMNLVLNARDALPEGGLISIETANVDLDEDYTRRHVGIVPGPHVMLAVKDTGVGIDKEVLLHIFEPFFTTKGQGKGTGLGLSTVYGIVTQSGGHITVESEQGAGTTMKVYLPRIDAPDELDSDTAAPAQSVRGTETVLLVEDEDAVRAIARTFLQQAGYTILTAGSGTEALALCETHTAKIDLLLTDVVMPEMNGPALAARVAGIRPDIRVLYMSGHADEAVLRREVLEAGAAFLAKPFSAAALASKVRELLDSPGWSDSG